MTLAPFQNWVLQTGLAVSLLILVILVIRRPFARAFGANAAYALWSLPLVRLCLPGLSVPQNWVPEFTWKTSEIAAAAPPVAIPTTAPVSTSGDTFVLTPLLAPETIQWGVIIIGVWLGVAVLWLGYQLLQQRKFKAHLNAQSSGPIARLFTEIERASETVGLRKAPEVRVALDGTGPLVTGVFNPLVVVPNNFAETFNAQQRHFALVHEFAHIKRRDLWVALATLIFRSVNWPNPLVHYASHKLRGDQEAACDAFVVKVTGGETAHSYAETLVKAVRQEGASNRKTAHLALSLTPTDNEILKGD